MGLGRGHHAEGPPRSINLGSAEASHEIQFSMPTSTQNM